MKKRVKLHDREFEVMIPEERILEAVKRVADKINADYTSDDCPILLGVLNGSFLFMADLARQLNFRCEVSFMKIASYDGCSSTGKVKELIGLNTSIKGRNVIVVEDIVDTGRSITYTLQILRAMEVASVRVATLFLKPEAYKGSDTIDYAAMEIGNEFIVGYGLDYNQLGRELKDIYVTK
ncbi:MAG: hypoxanthine phosphoribosyltransferase [Rikenellaceae bacterium]